jgi:uncharacterized protein DUF4242
VFVAFYLVERYVPSLTPDELATAVVRLDELSAVARHVWTVVVLDEDTCLSVFEASDADAVEMANARANFHLDRVVEVTSIEGGAGAERAQARRVSAALRPRGRRDRR